MTLTYDPIQDYADVPRRWFGSSAVAPELGTAHVLVRASAQPLVVWHGHPLPQSKVGAHQRYVVNVANNGLSFAVEARSSNPVFPFAVTVGFACRILDPLTIVRDNIHDVTAALIPSLSRQIRDTAARFDILEPTEAARAIETRLSSAHPSPVVQLSGFSVRVDPVNTQGVVEAEQELSVQKRRREGMAAVSHGTVEDQYAQLLATNNGNVRELMKHQSDERKADALIKLQALEIATGKKLEDVDVAQVQRNAFNSLFNGGGNDDNSPKESMRAKVERRAKAAIEEGSVVEGNVPATDATGATDKKAAAEEPFAAKGESDSDGATKPDEV